MEGFRQYAAFIRRAQQYRAEHPQQRRGQAMFNVLGEFDKEAEQLIRGTPLDPFYARDAAELEDFLRWLRTRWNAIL